MASDVKFIRVHGRIVPIRAKGDSAKRGAILRKTAAYDQKLSGQGKKVAGASAVGAIAAGAVGVLKKSKKFSIAAGILGFSALLNHGFASGREMSAKDRIGYAKQVESGKTKLRHGTGFGGASARAYREASFIARAPKQAISKIHGYLFRKKK